MIGLLYDVHGNLPALDAVLADARGRGARRWLIGGDVALFGAWPAETVARLRELEPATWIRGNGERWTADPASAPDGDPVQGATAAARDALGDGAVAELAALPESAQLPGGARAWHGSPVSDVRSFLPEPADDEDELLAGVTEPRLVFGHTHLAFRRTTGDGIELVNPGSVGMPFDGDHRAAYALLDDDGALTHHRVAYDHAASAAALAERYGDAAWIEVPVRRLAQARF
jgi:diadenosine tetraphosphatase ApaH/serine/threonine PP2A family protein phosphatase